VVRILRWILPDYFREHEILINYSDFVMSLSGSALTQLGGRPNIFAMWHMMEVLAGLFAPSCYHRVREAVGEADLFVT
jgi:hypothetical protein